MDRVLLNCGNHMPIIGHTASVYGNESDIGAALNVLLPEHGLERKDIFITSKLGPKEHGLSNCCKSCLQSIERLGCNYLDLYLIHWPGAQGMQPQDSRHKDLRKESWLELEKLVQDGKTKAIGISNYLQHHIEDLLSYSTMTPAVLQIEHHPHLQQKNLISICKKHNIHFQAYSSLGTSTANNQLLTNSVVREIAGHHHKSPAQILLRWAIQQGIGVLPKSTNEQHIADNINVFDFELTETDMNDLSALDKQHHYCWNPETVS